MDQSQISYYFFKCKDGTEFSSPLHPVFHRYGTSITAASQAAPVIKNPPANAGELRDASSIPGSGRSPGGGNGNPFQYSNLENSMGRGVWQATIHGVRKSQTGLSDWAGMLLKSNLISSVAKLCPTLCDPRDCSTPSFPVHHQLPELAQTHVYWVSDAIQPSHPLSFPFPLTFNLSQLSVSFPVSQFFISGGQRIGVSASASVLPMNIQDWFPLGLTGSPCSSRDSQESSPTPQFKTINSLALSLLHSPALTSIRDHWKNHSLD